MLSRHIITLCMFMALLFAQLATIHHNALHLDHTPANIAELLDTHTDDIHSEEQQSTKHECPECLLSKTLNVTLASAPIGSADFSFATLISWIENDVAVTSIHIKDTYARGPPPLLI